jgi:hypothetical protein
MVGNHQECRDAQDACLGDDRAAIAMPDKKRGAVLKVENSLRCGDIVLERGFRFLTIVTLKPSLVRIS